MSGWSLNKNWPEYARDFFLFHTFTDMCFWFQNFFTIQLISLQFWYCRLNFKTFGLKLDNIRYCLNFCAVFDRSAHQIQPWKQNKHQDWLISRKVCQVQMIPDFVNFQTKGFEIKLIVNRFFDPCRLRLTL